MAATATSRSSSGPSVSGKPWPRFTEPVAAASSDMVAKIVVVKGRSRRVRYDVPGSHRDDRTNGDFGRLWSGRTVLSIANYNMHCGMDGWGRPYDYVGAVRALDADVIVLEEAWTSEGDAGGGQAAEAARALGYQLAAHTMGRGRRIRPQPDAPGTWRARAMWADENKALYMDGVRPLPERVRALARWQEAEPGTLGIAVLVRPDLPMEATRLVHMRRAARRPRPAGRPGGRPHGGRGADIGGGHPHGAPALRLAPQLGRTAAPAADRRPAQRGARRAT